MIHQDDLLYPTTVDAVTFPLELQNIGSEEKNEEFINIIQLTNNDYNDGGPSISGNNVVWDANIGNEYGGSSYEVFLYNGTNNIQLTNDNYFGFLSTEISGHNILWYTYGAHSVDAFLYNGVTTTQIIEGNRYGSLPEISGNKVVWSSWSYFKDGNDDEIFNREEIFLYDGTTTIQLTDNNYNDRSPDISGNSVVWAGYDGNDTEIYLHDGNTTIQLNNNNYYDGDPQISGNNVIWTVIDDNDQGIFNRDDKLFLYDGNTTTQITDNNYYVGLINSFIGPQISDNNVVWSFFDGNDYELFLYNGTTTLQLTDNDYDDLDPQISGNKVVWQGYLESNLESEIFIYDGTTILQLTDNDYESSPQISGNNVVWSESDGNDTEIFLATLPSNISESTPIVLSPSISIHDISLAEGDEGNTNFTFTVSIAQVGNETITLDYATSDNTAFAGEDYIATSGTLEFDPGTTEKTIAFEVIGDTEVEETEFFTVTLSNATNAVIVDSQGKAVIENDDILPIELYRFRHETGGYLFVGEQEKDAILANPNYNQTFTLEGIAEDGTVNPAFIANVTSGVDLVPFYRLRSLDTPGSYLFVTTGEYNSIFAESSHYKDSWIKEGLDIEGLDIPDFYLYGPGANQGIEFHRFQNINNHSYLFAGPVETEAIYNDPLLSANYTDEGLAFESLI